MVALGFALMWGGYSVALWGWCLLRDYDVTFGQLVSPTHPYGSGQNEPWPPPLIPDTQVWPGKPPPPSAAAKSSSGCPDGKPPDPVHGRCSDGSIPQVAGGTKLA